ncbi:MAG: hypothetical protein E7033_01420 [Akkermansiaceae bacterium]|nr:hypothetical protein [Akkermansiaceae bacterium]
MIKTLLLSALVTLAAPVAFMGMQTTAAAVAAAGWTSPHDLETEREARVALLPFPQEVQWKSGALNVKGKQPEIQILKIDDAAMLHAAMQDAGFSTEKPRGATYSVKLQKTQKYFSQEQRAEGYLLIVDNKGVRIYAETQAGLFNGFQTFRQMLATCDGKLPYCEIKDWPAFSHRGYMQDCGRNFRSVERLKQELALAAQLKVNVFHWHLTDYPAWHVQCKAYPQLNAPEHRTRDKNDTYSYEQIREVIQFAKERNITVIPELDMPGHSAYFERAFGFKMHTPQGMKIVGELLDEFCAEIPAEMCPIIHFGADEVRIPNAAEFVAFVTQKLQSHGRTPMQWASHRDLPVGEHSIEQRWGEGADLVAKSIPKERIKRRAFDSTMGYSNLFDPALMVRRYFFMRPCGVGAGDELRLGTIMCIWPDGKVDNKEYIPGMCNMWPSMMAMAERAWKGGASDGDALPLDMPAADTHAGEAYRLFEQRMQKLRRTMFAEEAFPVWAESAVTWMVVEPVNTKQAAAVRDKVLKGEWNTLKTRKAHCANLYFRTRPDTGYLGMFSATKPGHTVWAVTTIDAKEAGPHQFMVGFDAPARSNRRYTGVPKNGEWSGCGTRIWLNGQEIKSPRPYSLAGKNNRPANEWNFERPLHPEEIWWVQQPIEIELQKGKNTFIIEQPYVGEHQSWGVSLIPVKE